MTQRHHRRCGAATVAPGSLLYQQKSWRAFCRSQAADAYIIALPANNRRLRLCLVSVASRLVAKGLPVKVVEVRDSLLPETV
jgi:hypothetical protein